MYLFCRTRATLIPTIAVPVVLLGTFAVLAAFGFSINTLTMFGMVLAIGLLADDATVVVENVERVMTEEAPSAEGSDAQIHVQIQGALAGIAMVPSAVAYSGWPSLAVQPGQFIVVSITIVSAMALSVLVALILTLALCATMPSNPPQRRSWRREKAFSAGLTACLKSTHHYTDSVQANICAAPRYLPLYLIIVGGLSVRSSAALFLPDEVNRGVFLTMVQLAGATQERTRALDEVITDYYSEQRESQR